MVASRGLGWAANEVTIPIQHIIREFVRVPGLTGSSLRYHLRGTGRDGVKIFDGSIFVRLSVEKEQSLWKRGCPTEYSHSTHICIYPYR
jgi:hypothetical protein